MPFLVGLGMDFKTFLLNPLVYGGDLLVVAVIVHCCFAGRVLSSFGLFPVEGLCFPQIYSACFPII